MLTVFQSGCNSCISRVKAFVSESRFLHPSGTKLRPHYKPNENRRSCRRFRRSVSPKIKKLDKETWLRVCFMIHVFIHMALLHLPAMVRPLPPVEPVRVSWSQEPAFHPRPGVDAGHTALQQVRCKHTWTALPAATGPKMGLRCFSTALTTSLMPRSRPTCW